MKKFFVLITLIFLSACAKPLDNAKNLSDSKNGYDFTYSYKHPAPSFTVLTTYPGNAENAFYTFLEYEISEFLQAGGNRGKIKIKSQGMGSTHYLIIKTDEVLNKKMRCDFYYGYVHHNMGDTSDDILQFGVILDKGQRYIVSDIKECELISEGKEKTFLLKESGANPICRRLMIGRYPEQTKLSARKWCDTIQ